MATIAPQKMRKTLGLIILFIFVRITISDTNFPTYDHPKYKNQLCYQCPPGYYLYDDCRYTRDGRINWPDCRLCPNRKFSQRWNNDPYCWDHESCQNGHIEVFNGGKIGPIKCACKASMTEVGGLCEQAVTLDTLAKNHTRTTSQERSKCITDCAIKIKEAVATAIASTTTTTSKPCPTISSTECPICPTAAPVSADPPGHTTGILVLAVIATMIIAFILGIIASCVYQKLRKKRENAVPVQVNEIVYVKFPQEEGIEDASTADTGKQTDQRKDDDSENRRKTSPINIIGNDMVQSTQENDINVGVSSVRKLGSAIPMDSVTTISETSKDVLDDACRALEKKIYKHDVADYFMRQVLGFSAENVDRIQADVKAVFKQLREAFRLWKGGDVGLKPVTVESLLRSLQEHNKHSLAEYLAKELNMTLEKPEKKETEDDQLDKAIGVCEVMITKKRAQSFFRTSLGLQNNVVETLQDENFVRNGLTAWKETIGSKANAESLLMSLEKAKYDSFQDVVDEIRKILKLAPDKGKKQTTKNQKGESKNQGNEPRSSTSPQQKKSKRAPPPPRPKPPKKQKMKIDFDDDNEITEMTGLLETPPETKNKAGPELPTETTRENDSTKQGTTAELSDKNDSESESEYCEKYDKDQDDQEMKYVDDFSEGPFKKHKDDSESDSEYYKKYDKDQDDKKMKHVENFSEGPLKKDKAGPEPPKDVTRETQPPESNPHTTDTPVRPTLPPARGSRQRQGQPKKPHHGATPSSSKDKPTRKRLTSDSLEVTPSASGISGVRPTTPEAKIKGEDGDLYPISYDERNDRIVTENHNYFDEPPDGNGVKDSTSNGGENLLSNGDATRPSTSSKSESQTEPPEDASLLSSSKKEKRKKKKEIFKHTF